MEIKLDENLPEKLIEVLSSLGQNATTCAMEGLEVAKDSVIADRVFQEGKVLATFDLDFSDLRKYPPGSHPGIIVLRLRSQDIKSCVTAFQKLFSQISEGEIYQNLVIVEETRVRIRRLDEHKTN
jgi:predicted nuclease of predicted toxin-antitoxin system